MAVQRLALVSLLPARLLMVPLPNGLHQLFGVCRGKASGTVCVFVSERRGKRRSETSSGTVVGWISGCLEFRGSPHHVLREVKEEILGGRSDASYTTCLFSTV